MSANADNHSHGNHEVRFESTDVSTAPIVTAVVALAAFAVVFTGIAYLVFQALAAREFAASPAASPLAAEYAAKEPPEPRLQLDPKKDLDILREAEAKALRTLDWVDKDKGLVRVPIERAMEMLVARGLPARQGPVPSKMAPRGTAPKQYGEGAGAPDWQDAAAWGRGGGHGAASHGEASHGEAAKGDAAHGEAHGGH